MSRPSRGVRRRAVAFAAFGALLAGCASEPASTSTPDPTATSEPAGPTRADRIAAIEAARPVLGPAAVALAQQAPATADVVLEVRGDGTIAPDRRIATARAVRAERIDALGEAVLDARDAIAGMRSFATDDVAAAVVALTAATDAAEALRIAAMVELDLVEILAGVDLALVEFIAEWDVEGSRRVQLERFAALRDAAAARADELEQRPERACHESVSTRAAALRAVAEHTEELRVLVRDYRGVAFDQRRAELRRDPYELGPEPIVRADASDAACLAGDVGAFSDTELIVGAVTVVQEALSPADLLS